ncbi:MBL fold metallo-hydrolase, partial [Bradyrhizobium uaiense]|uniref:MBL fold metallo-hydrolase n=1 Tax=Bradyrhizobium uaiense TaxID=2594946 RepID=UPI001F33A807
MIDVGLSSNYPSLVACLNHLGITPDAIDMVVLSHEHLDHIGAVLETDLVDVVGRLDQRRDVGVEQRLERARLAFAHGAAAAR